jgi:exosome complex component RRP4
MKKEKTKEKDSDADEKGYREVVIPGEFLDDKKGRKLGNGVYSEGEKIFAAVLGVPIISENEIRIVPMSGVYIPNINDKVVGIIKRVEFSGWIVDIGSPYVAFLPVSDGVDEFVDTNRMDISKFFDVGDVIFCKISKVTRDKNVRVSMRSLGARKLYGGVLLNVKPTKVPRIIGRGGSMVNLIKSKTSCLIYIGKNGVIWIRGDNKDKAIEAILTVERESNIVGLTEKIEKMLEDRVKKPKNVKEKGEKDGKD